MPERKREGKSKNEEYDPYCIRCKKRKKKDYIKSINDNPELLWVTPEGRKVYRKYCYNMERAVDEDGRYYDEIDRTQCHPPPY